MFTTPGGNPTSSSRLHELDDRERVLAGGPHDDGVARRERGAELADHVHEREVVRRDARDDADGRAAGERADEPAGRERGRLHLLRRERDARSAPARRRRSARAGSTTIGTCIVRPTFVVQPVSAMTSGTSSLARAFTASAAAWRSRGALLRAWSGDHAGNASCAARGRGAGLVGRRLGRVGDDLLGRRVHDRVGAVAAGDPLAADQQPVGVLSGQGRCSRRSLEGGRRGRARSGRRPRLEQVLIRVPAPRRSRDQNAADGPRPGRASGPITSTSNRSRAVPDIAAELEALGYGDALDPRGGRAATRSSTPPCCSAAPSA